MRVRNVQTICVFFSLMFHSILFKLSEYNDIITKTVIISKKKNEIKRMHDKWFREVKMNRHRKIDRVREKSPNLRFDETCYINHKKHTE